MPGGFAILAPAGFLALLALGVILVIHMRRRTPPTINLPSLRFWDPVEADRSDQRRFQVPPVSLPLILQLLAALAIALALVRPTIDVLPGLASQRTEPTNTIVVLDGSTSMLALAEEGDARTRWDHARTHTMAELDDWQAGDVMTVLVAATQSQTLSASTRPQVDRVRNQLQEMPAPGGISDINAALRLASHLFLPDRENRLVLVTDGAVAVDPATVATVIAPIELVVVGQYDSSLPNVAVTSIGARSLAGLDATSRLTFTLSSFADDTLRLPYRVQADGVDVVASEIDLAASESRTVHLTLPPGSRSAAVSIDVRDPFMADNRAQVLLDRSGGTGLNILLISDAPGPLERALTALPDSSIDTFPTSTPGLRALSTSYDLTVLEGISPNPDDIPVTPMLLVRPTPLGDRFATTGVLASPSIDRLDATSPILDGVDLGGVTFGDTPRHELAASELEIVRGIAGDETGPLIWTGTLDDIPYVVLGFDLATSNITQRVAFPILIARGVEAITAPTIPGAVSIGEPIVIDPALATTTLAVTNPLDQTFTYDVPDAGPFVIQETGRSGLHTFIELNDSGQVLSTRQLVINAGTLAESDLRPNPDLAASLEGEAATSAGITSALERSELWPLLAGMALAVIALEWMISRAGGSLRPGSWPWRRLPPRSEGAP